MSKFSIEPMFDPGNGDHLACEEGEATHWAVIIDGDRRVICETRADAEAHAARLDRADRFVWRDGDVEHHND